MTFQNLISRIPKWNQQIIENERQRICEKSGCNYLEDLVTCVHIIQLKILTAMRVGQKQKKIDIVIPKLDDFIHKVYINVARKVYKNVYLFEINIQPLQIQKNYRELEIIVQECILNTLRENIPVEAILKAYMDESVEEDVIEEIKEEVTHEPIIEPIENNTGNTGDSASASGAPKPSVSFNNIDYIKTDEGVSQINAPKSLDRLEEISAIRNEQRKMESEDDDDNVKLQISGESFNLDNLDIHNIEEPKLDLLPDLLIDEIEILE
jgi:GTP:adenosylcobinamide-phosphate guanylyltransferase